VIEATDGDLRRAGLNGSQVTALRRTDRDALEADAAWLAGEGHGLLTAADEDYPALLLRIPDPPPVLYVQGDPAALWTPQLAVVGSRNPTAGGRDNAREFCRYLARSGLTITSGLAAGVDGEAHAAALEAGGVSVAVAGTGLDRVYPARHREMAHRIAARGGLVSEFTPGTGVRRERFPSRNRIISGLSLGVLVVEAAVHSGSLITARHAVEQGREVFAIPGSIHNPMARGCHRLIRQGAKLVETAADVVEDLAPMARELGGELHRLLGAGQTSRGPASGDPGADLDPEEQKVLEAIGYDPTSVDRVAERTGLTPESVSSMLLIMEMRGLVAASGGGLYSRTHEESE
jgi:DNA processing protein